MGSEVPAPAPRAGSGGRGTEDWGQLVPGASVVYRAAWLLWKWSPSNSGGYGGPLCSTPCQEGHGEARRAVATGRPWHRGRDACPSTAQAGPRTLSHRPGAAAASEEQVRAAGGAWTAATLLRHARPEPASCLGTRGPVAGATPLTSLCPGGSEQGWTGAGRTPWCVWAHRPLNAPDKCPKLGPATEEHSPAPPHRPRSKGRPAPPHGFLALGAYWQARDRPKRNVC